MSAVRSASRSRQDARPPGEYDELARLHIAAADELSVLGSWRQACEHLRAAVDLLRDVPVAVLDAVPPVRDELDRLRREHAEAREQSRRDFLTASYNRRYLDERLGTLLDDPAVQVSGMSVALVDIDHFKQINDRFGHPFGDRVLKHVVAELDAALPGGAFCARYGGEEFALVLPGRSTAEAVPTCEDARSRVAQHRWRDLDAGLRVTVSIGVADTGGGPLDVEQLIVGADVLLYAAKESGRNAVAFRDDQTRLVRLAGDAAGRRAIPQPLPAVPPARSAPPATA